MKRLTDNYRLRAKRIAKAREASRLNGRPKKRMATRRRTQGVVKPFQVIAPTTIQLLNTAPHHGLMTFLRVFRKEAQRNRQIVIDFKNTVAVHSCGMLLMLAEVDRAVRVLGGRCTISCTYPASQKVEKVFQQIGFFKLLGKDHRLEVTEDDRDVYNWRFATGTEVSPILADPILKGIKDQIPMTFRKVVVGVEEAMDNSIHHAYIESRNDRLSNMPGADDRRWWLFAEVLDDWLHVVFCDLGIGIPRSLPRSWSDETGDIVSLALSRRKKDVRMISRAFKVGRTRTDQDHRGKGLKNIAAAARELGGRLTVHSNAGCVLRDYRHDSQITQNLVYKRSIMGTVVQWSIPVKTV